MTSLKIQKLLNLFKRKVKKPCRHPTQVSYCTALTEEAQRCTDDTANTHACWMESQ